MKYKNWLNFILVLNILNAQTTRAEGTLELTEEESEDLKDIIEEAPAKKTIEENKEKVDKKISTSNDQLKDLESDIGKDDSDIIYQTDMALRPNDSGVEEVKVEDLLSNKNKGQNSPSEKSKFEAGDEEKKLLEIAKNFQIKLSEDDWKKVQTSDVPQMYQVVEGDWLFKISKKFFGTGFYYPKIWALNPYITNPHEIEPGMILVFSTGTEDKLPDVQLGSFTDKELSFEGQQTAATDMLNDKNQDTEMSVQDKYASKWLKEKQKLIEEGIYIQYATDKTMTDILNAVTSNVSKEYKMYKPEEESMNPSDKIPENIYDESGFDKNSKISFNYKDGFYLNTFLSTNLVQDVGKLENSRDNKIIITSQDNVYVRFDSSVNVMPGDRFSIYIVENKIEHKNSDRSGYKYTIVGQIKTLEKVDDKWKCEVSQAVDVFQRGARVTLYTPKIDTIKKTFNNRKIEAIILGSYNVISDGVSFGDVVYLDRGRADGVEIGNIFDVYGFQDDYLKRNITATPTYKTGELVVISLTDNFATALVSNSNKDFRVGDYAISKSKLEAAKTIDEKKKLKTIGRSTVLGKESLDELDVELNLDGLNDDLLNQVDKVEFSEEELAEIERAERKNTVIRDNERDMKALERLEKEIEQAEGIINEAKLDEDKLLEDESLEKLEDTEKSDEFDVDAIEDNLGKLYLDEDVNGKDNPYGLTEFDLEEIDELLNAPKEGKSVH